MYWAPRRDRGEKPTAGFTDSREAAPGVGSAPREEEAAAEEAQKGGQPRGEFSCRRMRKEPSDGAEPTSKSG